MAPATDRLVGCRACRAAPGGGGHTLRWVFADKTVTNNIRDLVAAATALIRRGYGPCAMVGHSLGGAAVLLAAQRTKTSAASWLWARPLRRATSNV